MSSTGSNNTPTDNGFTSHEGDGTVRFWVYGDNGSTTATYTIRYQTTATGLVVGNSYTLSAPVISEFGSYTQTSSSPATLQMVFGSVTSPTYSTQPTSGQSGLGTVNGGTSQTVVTLPAFTATSTSALLTITLTLAARSRVNSDDIGVSRPTLTCLRP